MATRPARSPPSTSPGSAPAHSTQVVGCPGGATDPASCQSLPPTGIAAGSQASHHDSGMVQRRSSQLGCHTSSSGGRRRIGRIQLSGPANGWLTDSSPPPASVSASQSSGSRRKSIQPTAPSAFACPPAVVTSWPGSSVTPYLRAAPASSACWLIVLWSVMARKSRPRSAASAVSSGTVSRPSECTVCACRSPASQRRPGQRQLPARRPVQRRRRGRRSGRQQAGRTRRGLRRYPVAHAVRRDVVHADHHLPDPGLQLARQVSGCGPVRGDDERPARPARPAAEPVRPQAAQVEYGVPGPVVFQLDPQPGGARPHLHRQVMPRRGEPVLERPPPVVCSLAAARSTRHAIHPTRSSRRPPNPVSAGGRGQAGPGPPGRPAASRCRPAGPSGRNGGPRRGRGGPAGR